MILFSAYLAQTKCAPFKRPSLNRCESHGLLTSLMTLFAGLGLQSPNASETLRIFISIAIFTINGAYFALVAAELYWHSDDIKASFSKSTHALHYVVYTFITLVTLTMHYKKPRTQLN